MRHERCREGAVDDTTLANPSHQRQGGKSEELVVNAR